MDTDSVSSVKSPNLQGAILITSAGRRVSLLRIFQEAAHGAGLSVIAVDTDPLSPALQIADRGFLTPLFSDPGYLDHLRAIVEREGVRLLVPTLDTGLRLFAENAADLKSLGCQAVISSPEFIEITRDKWKTGQHFAAAEIAVPRSWLPGDLQNADLPEELFVKPRSGAASIDTHRATASNIAALLDHVSNPIIQEFLNGEEITIDALISFKGVPIHFVPRRRLKTIGGESVQGVTIRDSNLTIWIEKLLSVCAESGARGALTIQAFLTSTGPVLTEINARFGGGFPLAHAAGAEYPKWLIQEMLGQNIEPRMGDYREGLYMTRHSVEVFLEKPFES